MTAKLHIDISQGVLDIEGDAGLVREIYSDFKDLFLSHAPFAPPAPASAPPMPSDAPDGGSDTISKPKSKRRVSNKKKPNVDEVSNGVPAPKLDKNLDTSGLSAFYGQFSPKNNSERILIFLKFMTEILGIDSPNTDQVYTCFKASGEKIPKAFAQAFYDASGKHGYIDFRTSTDLPITISGDNHFNHVLKKKASE